MGKMALKLRRDVQKASYYVWFLGAQEARGLRGSRVLLPVIPRLLERSREQEPLKVTLQISHKGLKIIQGSSKHFIPHTAITCSVQTDDIVACVLLLYNPATKCPLHVHAYRCDSETTAQALNQQLQILINRQENQKRFNELETRLGLTQHDAPQLSPKTTPTSKIISTRFDSSPRRFESSLGSDTGTSTRESECSEELSPTSPILSSSVSNQKANLFDSLAAELRAKLSGNGPPLLLPPRDYDTVHRSKGNLAAIELRRCRNTSIVGPPKTQKPGVISSRGSSGIGSDLAPSPERQEGQTSSDEEWRLEQQELKSTSRRSIPPDDVVLPSKYKNLQQSYIYPRNEKLIHDNEKYITELKENMRYQRSSSREEDKSQRDSINSKDDEDDDVKPIVTSKMRSAYRDPYEEKKYVEDVKRFHNRYEEKKPILPQNDQRYSHHESRRYSNNTKSNSELSYRDEETLNRKESSERGKYIDRDKNYRNDSYLNLTDKQKYRESLAEKRINQMKYQEKTIERKDRYRDESLEKIQHKYRDGSIDKMSYTNKYDEFDKNRYNREKIVENKKYVKKTNHDDEDDENNVVQYRTRKENYNHNPYKQPESQPYRESIEKMLKSPVMRYKSIDDSQYTPENDKEWIRKTEVNKRYSSNDCYRDPSPVDRYHNEPNIEKTRQRKTVEDRQMKPSPESVRKISPKDRFQDAKEKFQAMERERLRVQEKNKLVRKGSMEPARRGSIESPITPARGYSEKNSHDGWSSEEEQPPLLPSRYREKTAHGRYSDIEREPMPQTRVAPSKSLSNLVKGYRHSYAEPQRNPLPRGSGRVGLAAVNPY